MYEVATAVAPLQQVGQGGVNSYRRERHYEDVHAKEGAEPQALVSWLVQSLTGVWF